jgi:hypothetical protein
VEVCGQNILNLVFKGRLKARSSAMKNFISHVRSERSEEFNDEVAELFKQTESCIVRMRVKKIGSRPIEDVKGQPLGDIDVLAVYPRKRKILAVETKDFEMARTPFEFSNEADKLFSGNKSAVALHQRRIDWLQRHAKEVYEWLCPEQARGTWRVEGLIVISRRLATPYLQRIPMKVVAFEDLADSGLLP